MCEGGSKSQAVKFVCNRRVGFGIRVIGIDFVCWDWGGDLQDLIVGWGGMEITMDGCIRGEGWMWGLGWWQRGLG